jgi:hypothetical protein
LLMSFAMRSPALRACFESDGNGMTAVSSLAYNSNRRSSVKQPHKHYSAIEKVPFCAAI